MTWAVDQIGVDQPPVNQYDDCRLYFLLGLYKQIYVLTLDDKHSIILCANWWRDRKGHSSSSFLSIKGRSLMVLSLIRMMLTFGHS